ncbi:hypothetical protein Bbelb_328390 [Branchiostoma belcheri]|nr:hypothetical protein Bbelb_328390 [Branchiostoma belcheri]
MPGCDRRQPAAEVSDARQGKPRCQTVSRAYTGQLLGSRANMLAWVPDCFQGLHRLAPRFQGKPRCQTVSRAYTGQLLGSRANMLAWVPDCFHGLYRPAPRLQGQHASLGARLAYTGQLLGSRTNILAWIPDCFQGLHRPAPQLLGQHASLDARLIPGQPALRADSWTSQNNQPTTCEHSCVLALFWGEVRTAAERIDGFLKCRFKTRPISRVAGLFRASFTCWDAVKLSLPTPLFVCESQAPPCPGEETVQLTYPGKENVAQRPCPHAYGSNASRSLVEATVVAV